MEVFKQFPLWLIDISYQLVDVIFKSYKKKPELILKIILYTS